MPLVQPTRNAEPKGDLLPEGGQYTARIVSIKPKEIKWVKDGEAKSAVRLNWRWEITDGEFKGRNVFGTTNSDLELNRRNRFRDIVQTLLSRELKETDPPLDTDDLVDMVADIVIGYRADRKDPEIKYAEVADVLPAGDSVFQINDEPPF